MNNFDKKRLQANRDLVLQLFSLIELYPNLRFGQILENFGFVEYSGGYDNNENPIYYWNRDIHLEPTKLIVRVQKTIDERSPIK